jgi:hypothetical protein
VQQAQRDVETPLHTSRVGPDRPVGRLAQAEPLEHLVGSSPQLSTADPVEGALEDQVLPAGGLLGGARTLADDADGAPNAFRLGQDVVARHPRLPGVGLGERGQDFHRRGLSGAVRAEQAEDRPALDTEGEAGESFNLLPI